MTNHNLLVANAGYRTIALRPWPIDHRDGYPTSESDAKPLGAAYRLKRFGHAREWPELAFESGVANLGL